MFASCLARGRGRKEAWPNRITLLDTKADGNEVAVEHRPHEAVTLRGGLFLMGTDDPAGFPEDGEGLVRLAGFSIDKYPVTNRRFAWFVAATGYRTGVVFLLRLEGLPPSAGAARIEAKVSLNFHGKESCPAWIRTMKRGSKDLCDTISPQGKSRRRPS